MKQKTSKESECKVSEQPMLNGLEVSEQPVLSGLDLFDKRQYEHALGNARWEAKAKQLLLEAGETLRRMGKEKRPYFMSLVDNSGSDVSLKRFSPEGKHMQTLNLGCGNLDELTKVLYASRFSTPNWNSWIGTNVYVMGAGQKSYLWVFDDYYRLLYVTVFFEWSKKELKNPKKEKWSLKVIAK